MQNDTYNGWKNRETWLVPLWWYECPVESVEADTKEEAVETLAEQIESLFDELMSEHSIPSNGLLMDLLQGAISKIDWREIAEHWIDDIEVKLTEGEEVE